MTVLDLTYLLLVVAALQAKHAICDGPLQTLPMIKAKRTYLGVLGLAHASIHGAGTLSVMVLAGVPLQAALMLSVLDLAIHYHVDFGKEYLLRKTGWTATDGAFWWAYGFDQMLHQLTYLLLAWLAFKP